jgi:hypothetical protein
MQNRYGGSSDYTVTHVLNHMDDIIEAIEDINTKGAVSALVAIPNTQAATNIAMQEKVGALENYLYTYDGRDGAGNLWSEQEGPYVEPDIVGYMANGGDSSTYIAAINLGKAYIAANS